jgi:RNA polymerase sporulation-specific sigma factor
LEEIENGGNLLTDELEKDPFAAYVEMEDEQIVKLAQEHHDGLAMEYLLVKYRGFVRGKARSYFLIGAEKEDIIQEGMIGLYKAIRDFRSNKQSSFRAFAELCVTRQIITAIKTATRQKHIPLNSYVSLNKPIYEDDSDRTLLDIFSGNNKLANPEDMIIRQEELSDIQTKMNKILSDLEWEVFMSYLEGKSYQETAQELHRHIKSIDNALQRVKRKVERYRETCAADMDIQAVCKSLMAVGRQRKVVTKSGKKAKK